MENKIRNAPTEGKQQAPKISPSAGTPNHDLIKWFTGIGASVFFITLIVWTSSLTMGIMDIVLPNNPAAKYYALALYDGGALVWLGMYAYKARGVPQHGISLLLFGLDFLGVILMTAAGVYMGGQSLADIPAWMGSAVVLGVIASTLANVGGAYYYKLNDPDTRESIQAQSLEDTISEEAMQQARANVEREARALGQIMATRATARLKYRLALPMTETERAAWDGEIIEVNADDIPALPQPQGLSFWEYLKSFFGRGRSTRSQSMLSSRNWSDLTPPQTLPEEEPAPASQEQQRPTPQV